MGRGALSSPRDQRAMFAYCAKCNYDSGDFDTREEIYQQIRDHGGTARETGETMEIHGHEVEKIVLRCPQGHDTIHID